MVAVEVAAAGLEALRAYRNTWVAVGGPGCITVPIRTANENSGSILP
jgi:hypothetical protein